MYVQNHESFTGNDRFEGYSINLIDEIAKELNFKYEFMLAPDGKYGSYNAETKKWDGLVKSLLDRVSSIIPNRRGTRDISFKLPKWNLYIKKRGAAVIKQQRGGSVFPLLYAQFLC